MFGQLQPQASGPALELWSMDELDHDLFSAVEFADANLVRYALTDAVAPFAMFHPTDGLVRHAGANTFRLR